MSMEYVRNYYNVPVRRGGKVKVKDSVPNYAGRTGKIASCAGNVRVRMDDTGARLVFHPTDLHYIDSVQRAGKQKKPRRLTRAFPNTK